MVHEYKVIPAPTRPQKVKGAKTTAEKFALSLAALMNEMGRDGWDYVRAETLPCEEKKGWTGRTDTSFQTLLIFRRDADALPPPAPTRVVEPARPSPLPAIVAGPLVAAPGPAGAVIAGPLVTSAGVVTSATVPLTAEAPLGAAPAVSPARPEAD